VKREILERRCAEMRARLTGETAAPVEHAMQSPQDPEPLRFKERHYTIKELVELWEGKVSHDTVRRMFINEPGVVDFSATATTRDKRKRRHRSILIPESVVIRVYNQRRLPGRD
jgi:hypothetical protein